MGAPDGVYGSGTKEAVINFQKSEGMEQSGELNPETLVALGVIDSFAAEADASAPVAELPAGTPVSVNSIEGDWAHVIVNGQQGFVYAENLATNKE